MRLAYFIREGLEHDSKVSSLFESLRSQGIDLFKVNSAAQVPSGVRALLSIGGDGTFLNAAQIAVQAKLPILGVNFGRLGFLSGVSPDELSTSLASNDFASSMRDVLEVNSDCLGDTIWPYALNEMSISRTGASMLGIDVSINGIALPTYWADGLLISTGAGSTAYSLSVGGPICTPDAEVFIVAPISSHNLNVRPLVVPNSSVLELSLRSRDDKLRFSADNRSIIVPSSTKLCIKAAPFKLERLSTSGEDFIQALRNRLFWGQDLRNTVI